MVKRRYFFLLMLSSCCVLLAEDDKGRLSAYDSLYLTLTNQKLIEVSHQNFVAQQGVSQSAAAPFDVNTLNTLNYSVTKHIQPSLGVEGHGNQQTTTYSGNVVKTFRGGTQFSMSASVTKIHSRFLYPPPEPPTTNTGILGFQLTQPLLKNFIQSAARMAEIASYMELYARYFDNLLIISQTIQTTLNSYWELVAAYKNLEIQKKSEERILKLQKLTEKLIANDQLARSDMIQVEQQLASQILSVLTAEQRVIAANETLKFSMGITSPYEECVEKIDIADDFPEVLDINAEFCEKIRGLTDVALENRYDLIAARYRTKENEYFLKGAANNLLPQLDVIAGTSYTNGTVGRKADHFFSSLYARHPQIDRYVGVQFSTPLCNDGPMGLYRTQYAQYLQSILNEQLLTQTLLSQLRPAVSNYFQLLKEIKEAHILVEKAQELVKNEYIKLKEGESTIFFVLNFEATLTSNLVAEMELHRLYSQNIVLIQYLTSTSFSIDISTNTIYLNNLYKFN